MVKYILKRFIALIPVLLGVTLISSRCSTLHLAIQRW